MEKEISLKGQHQARSDLFTRATFAFRKQSATMLLVKMSNGLIMLALLKKDIGAVQHVHQARHIDVK